MDTYEVTIGLEIHAELKTHTKMFCGTENDPDCPTPNANTCPVCLAHPGTLPVINREAIRHVLRVGAAVGARLADYTEFDRKNYFYPDLPKGYQLSQFEFPLVSGGEIAGVQLTRIHLEEDTASSLHDEVTGETYIDYNRAGVPLMELVTEPVIKSAAEAGAFAKELQLLLRYLNVSDADMEKGQMRVEANVSIAKPGERSAGYVEIKNLNSFKVMEKAVEYEIQRQAKILDAGGKIEKQTLGWDDNKQITFPQRTKEGSADYRYFPDPDLPSLRLSEIPGMDAETIHASVGMTPWKRRSMYLSMGIKGEDAESYVRDMPLGDFFDGVVKQLTIQSEVQLASNYIANDLVSLYRDSGNRDTYLKEISAISPEMFSRLVGLVYEKKITSRSAKDILAIMVSSREDIDPVEYAEKNGLYTVSDDSKLIEVVMQVVAAHPSVVADYKSGKTAALEFLFGQCMRILRGAGSPDALREALRKAVEA